MYRTIEDFTRDWKYDTEQTSKLLRYLTDESLNQQVTEEGRTLGFIAWHIVTSLCEMPIQVGLRTDGPPESTPVPKTANIIWLEFDQAAKALIDVMTEKWTDETLLIEDHMYGELWKRGQTLLYMMFHQAHHRGQLTVLMRQAGLRVNGIYGPSYEEWGDMNMTPLP